MTSSSDAGNASPGGSLALPDEAVGAVVFAHSKATRRHSSHTFISGRLRGAGFATLMCELSPGDGTVAAETSDRRVAVERLSQRIVAAIDRLHGELPTAGLPLATLGTGTAAGDAALLAAAERPERVRAVASRGGRPDLLAGETLRAVTAPVLLVIGGDDTPAIELATGALRQLPSPESRLEIIAGVSDGFDEPGAVELVADLASSWFKRHLGVGMPAASETAGG